MKKTLLLAVQIALSVLLARAQEEGKDEIGGITTDRPVQSETPTTIPKGFLQVELGGQYLSYKTDSTILDFSLIGIPLAGAEQETKEEVWSGPNMLIKYGLYEGMELRLIFNYVDFTREVKTSISAPIIGQSTTLVATDRTSGLTAPVLGMKFRLAKEKKYMPNAVLSIHSVVPLWGIEEYRPQDQNFIPRLTLGKTIYKSWYVLLGGEYAWSQSTHVWFYVAQTGYVFFEKLTACVELYGYNGPLIDVNAVDGALIYALGKNHQIDISGGFGLGGNFYDFYGAIGYSFRLNALGK